MDGIRITIYLILLLCLAALVVFVWLYATGSPWRLTILGRNLMYQKIILATILLLSLGGILLGHFFVYRLIQLVIYGVVLVSFIGDVVQLWRIQQRLTPAGLYKLVILRLKQRRSKKKTRQRV